ncbi:hypothetical protein [Candidatus Marithrix sp. Canyon 246]|uniref:hypothetical protein n=1 Tax=Candidatus Marithrix sp. Canyon 246 TaxID=1827136 RepID=UPI00114D3418|nr:hypothetical protein [Candidatus Marithrix sp. Canyon 246]
MVPFIDEFTGKETDNKGIFDVQLQEKTKLIFELIPWSINFKNTFNGDDASGYILYDHKTRSVKIPCFEVTTIAKFGDGIQGESIYYKDVSMKQRHVAYPIFHVDNMTKTDSCESSVEPIQKPTLTTIPTTTKDDTVEIEVNGKVGTTVFVNGKNSGKTIDSTGKVKVTLDTSGKSGDKSFSISLKDDRGNESETLIVVIQKTNIIYSENFTSNPNYTSLSTTGKATWNETDGYYRVETRDNLNDKYWAYSPKFTTFDSNKALSIELDILFENQDWGTYPGVRFYANEPTELGAENNKAIFSIDNAYRNNYVKQIGIYDNSGKQYYSPRIDNNVWYTIKLKIDDNSKADIEIVNLSTKNSIYSKTNVDFVLANFSYLGIGYYGKPDYGDDKSPIRIDNILIEYQ